MYRKLVYILHKTLILFLQEQQYRPSPCYHILNITVSHIEINGNKKGMDKFKIIMYVTVDSPVGLHLLSQTGDIIVGHDRSIERIQPGPGRPSSMACFAKVFHIHSEVLTGWRCQTSIIQNSKLQKLVL